MSAPQIGPPGEPQPEILFYDGHCALCHGAVKFVLKHDRNGTAFCFAPLQGGTFIARVPPNLRTTLPDSIVVLTNEGDLLLQSDAFLHILTRLGGGWRILASMLRVVPRFVRDAVYNFVAQIRYRVFGVRSDLCPLVSPELRSRFYP
ncbi:MAG: DCC1-like thiol-disulfide oxidoreductase family protein [Candidatus Acidiferrales bacterium]